MKRLRTLVSRRLSLATINVWVNTAYYTVLAAISLKTRFSFPVVALSVALACLHFFNQKIVQQEEPFKHANLVYISYAIQPVQLVLLMGLNYVASDEWVTILFTIYTASVSLNYPIYIAFPFVCIGYSTYLFLFEQQGISLNAYIPSLVNFSIFPLSMFAIRSLIQQRQHILELNQRLQSQANLTTEMTKLRERNSLAEAMHDTIGHTLTSSIVSLEGATLLLKNRPTEAIALLDSVREQLQVSLGDIRKMVRTLKTDTLADHTTLKDSLFQLGERISRQTSVEIEIQYQVESDLLPIQEYVLYSIVRESITNALKHSQATYIQVSFEEIASSCITLTIMDNGTGTNSFESGFGLTHLQQKVMALGGTLSIDTQAKAGFSVHVLMPLVLDRAIGSSTKPRKE